MVKTRALWIVALALVLCLGCAGCSGGKTGDPDKVTIAMGFIPNVQFTPMYVAIERGYFADEGIEVTLDYGMETDHLQRVGTNQIPFAIASGDQVILARANELPVTYIYNWYRRFPVCVVSLADKGLNQPEDLKGKKVGTPAMAGASYLGWMAFLKQAGIPDHLVDTQVIGYTQVASLIEGRVDAAICYGMNEPVQLTQAGYHINVFYLDNYTRLVSNGLITSDKVMSKQPKLAKSVVRAFDRGLRDTISDPDAAFEITKKSIPEMNESTVKLQRAVLAECINYWAGPELGTNQDAAWSESVAFLQEMGLISEGPKPKSLYSNKFIPTE